MLHVLEREGVSLDLVLQVVAEATGVELSKAQAYPSSNRPQQPVLVQAHTDLIHWYEREVLPSMGRMIIAALDRAAAQDEQRVFGAIAPGAVARTVAP